MTTEPTVAECKRTIVRMNLENQMLREAVRVWAPPSEQEELSFLILSKTAEKLSGVKQDPRSPAFRKKYGEFARAFMGMTIHEELEMLQEINGDDVGAVH